jgi:hypothetical protein
VFRHRFAADLQCVWCAVVRGRDRGPQSVHGSGRRPHTLNYGQVGLGVRVAILISLILVGLSVWKISQWQAASWQGFITASDMAKLQNDARATLIQGFGGAILLIGLYFTLRNLQIVQEGQITERFTRAIEQLGNDQMEVRLGGIYALERIARDSARDHWPIMEILAAYLRTHARWEEEPRGQPATPCTDDDEQFEPGSLDSILANDRKHTRMDSRKDCLPIFKRFSPYWGDVYGPESMRIKGSIYPDWTCGARS